MFVVIEPLTIRLARPSRSLKTPRFFTETTPERAKWTCSPRIRNRADGARFLEVRTFPSIKIEAAESRSTIAVSRCSPLSSSVPVIWRSAEAMSRDEPTSRVRRFPWILTVPLMSRDSDA